MEPFPQPLVSIAAPVIRDNIDTDIIIPSREIRSTGKTGLKAGLFAPWRYIDVDKRMENNDFILNHAEFAEARILLSGANLGCGSSREHAVWALAEWGIACIIAESFSPIFRANCTRNGILPIVLDAAAIQQLAGRQVTVDLANQEIVIEEAKLVFSIDEEEKQMLSQGLDQIDLTQRFDQQIGEWTEVDKRLRPWVYIKAVR